MRTYEHARETDVLGRYYTRTFVSDLLIEALPERAPSGIIDLGAGDGALSFAASARWPKFDLVTVDVDATAAQKIRRRMMESGFNGRHTHIDGDALAVGLKDLIRSAHSRMPTLAICNPPFQIREWRKGFDEILDAAGFSNAIPAVTTTDTALVFLAQNLLCLPSKGTLGIIVPDSLVSAAKYAGFREQLLSRYDVLRAIRLPKDSFRGTGALAHILVVSKKVPGTREVVLSELASLHGELNSITVSRDSILDRIDYRYYVSETRACSGMTLSDVAASVHRGTLSSAEIRATTAFVLHTTDVVLESRGRWLDFSKRTKDAKKLSGRTIIAEKGDILVARVGRNMEIKVTGVGAGQVALSDCLFRVRVQPEYRNVVLEALSSKAGAEWIAAHAYGVAASHLTKTQLLRFPIGGQRQARTASESLAT
jgi:type I restriction enzyme M protein